MTLLCVCAGVTSLAPTARAEEPYKPKVLPACKVYKTEAGGEVCGYATIEEVRELYAHDATLVANASAAEALGEVIELQGSQILDLRISVDAAIKAGEVWKSRSVTLAEDLIAKDLLYQDARVRPKWGTFIGFGSAALVGAILLGYVGNELLE